MRLPGANRNATGDDRPVRTGVVVRPVNGTVNTFGAASVVTPPVVAASGAAAGAGAASAVVAIVATAIGATVAATAAKVSDRRRKRRMFTGTPQCGTALSAVPAEL